jgi:hypothetical protein
MSNEVSLDVFVEWQLADVAMERKPLSWDEQGLGCVNWTLKSYESTV